MDESKIQWTNFTWNPWMGCHKVSEECDNCYWFRDALRYGKDAETIVRTKPVTFNKPVKIKEPSKIFTCSWSDFFISEADGFRDDAWQVIKDTPRHEYQVLTKRPHRIAAHLPADWGEGYDNVWLGVSVGMAKFVTRMEHLRKIPAKVRFVSAEPLLENIRFSVADLEGIHWVIIGGESGNETGNYGYRATELVWITDMIADCRAAGVKVFVKQLGTTQYYRLGLKDRHGGNAKEWRKELQVREYPV